jgi:dethiobiotin synthetase
MLEKAKTSGFFITGTDTGIGKTQVALALMRFIKSRGASVIGMKPVASGCVLENGALRNEDALSLQAESSVALPYEMINPYAFELPIAPHIAASRQGQTIEVGVIRETYLSLTQLADVVVVEGVGGWTVPLGDELSVAG